MPLNNDLEPIDLPVKLKSNERPIVEVKEHLSNIRVRIVSCPSCAHLLRYIPDFVTATWRDSPTAFFSHDDRVKVLNDVFKGVMLPTALETIGITFRIDNMDMIDVTHLIRHRVFSFSAQCTADRDVRHDGLLVKNSILQSKYSSAFVSIAEDAINLYARMVDSGDVSILDARTILPRCMPAFYYVRGNLKDVLQFIRTRLDEQIQPMSDNVIAMRLLVELVGQYPQIAEFCEIGGRDEWYIRTARTGRNSNIYMPKAANDVFEYTDKDFLYNKRRDEFIGADMYNSIVDECKDQIQEIVDRYEQAI